MSRNFFVMSVLKCSLALLLVCFTVTVPQQTTADGCYQEYTNNKVNCLSPFASQTASSNDDCTALCTQNSPKCKSAELVIDSQSCRLYDTALPVYRTSNRRKRATGCYGYGPSIMYSPGYNYYVQTSTGNGCSGYNGASTSSTIDPPTIPTTMPPTTEQNLPPEATCPSDKVIRYTVVDGYRLSSQPDFTFQASDIRTCLTACTNNRLPDGRQAPCVSADYNSQTKECAISIQAPPPVGTAKAEENANFKHYEKVCINAPIGQNCQGPYFRSPQHILVGFAQAVTTASSVADCLQMCVASQQRFNFACSSGMFYFGDSTNNCILNSESRSTQPELFTEESRDRVEYFEPGCTVSSRVRRQTAAIKARNRNILQLNLAAYSGWSMCDTISKNHMRFRQCTSYDPNNCQIDQRACDPSKENEYDLEVEASGEKFALKKNSTVENILKGTTSSKKPSTTSRSATTATRPATTATRPATTATRPATTATRPATTATRPATTATRPATTATRAGTTATGPATTATRAGTTATRPATTATRPATTATRSATTATRPATTATRPATTATRPATTATRAGTTATGPTTSATRAPTPATTATRSATTAGSPSSTRPTGSTLHPNGTAASTDKPFHFKRGDCAPDMKPDGKKDCKNGQRLLPNGKHQRCQPNKKECQNEKDKDKRKKTNLVHK